jgi:hypothetical protein
VHRLDDALTRLERLVALQPENDAARYGNQDTPEQKDLEQQPPAPAAGVPGPPPTHGG